MHRAASPISSGLAVAVFSWTSAVGSAHVELRNDEYEPGMGASFEGTLSRGMEFAATLVPEGAGPFQVLRIAARQPEAFHHGEQPSSR